MHKRALILVLIALALTACSRSAAGTLTASPSPSVPVIEVTTPPPAAVGQTTPIVVTPTPNVSPTPFVSFTVKPGVDNLKVRTGPGMLFQALILVQQTDTLTVIGMAPGGEWLNIKTADGTEGWVYSQFVQSSINLTQVPVVQPKDALLVKGHVADAAGNPIQGVGFDLSSGPAGQGSSNSVVTDANGDFYSFLPGDSTGTWTVAYTSMACPGSVWSDSSCKTYKAGYTGTVDPATQSVSLPQSTTLMFSFK